MSLFLENQKSSCRRVRGAWRWVTVLCALSGSGCGASPLPDPRAAAEHYATAVQQGDSESLFGMLSERAARELSRADVDQLLSENRDELRSFASELTGEPLRIRGRAEIFGSDQKVVELTLEEGRFWVDGGHVLPLLPTSPEEAAVALREALLARDYQRVVSLLAPEAREKFESVFEALDDSFAHLEDAVVDVRQDRAVIELSGGRQVDLVRKDGRWLVEEIH